MKKSISVLLILALIFSLCACGGSLSADELAKIEELGKLAGQKTYRSYEHVNEVLVAVPKGDKSVMEAISSHVGEFTYFNKNGDLKDVKGIVFESVGATSSSEKSFKYIYLCDYKSGDSDVNPIKYTFEGTTATSSSEQTSTDLSNGKVVHNGYTYKFDKSKGIVAGIKWLLAEQSVAFDDWKSENNDALAQALNTEKSVKEGVENWKMSTAYYSLRSADKIYDTYCVNTDFIDYLNTLVKELEKTTEEEYADVYTKLLKQNQYEKSVGDLLITKASYEKEITTLKPAADVELAKYEGEISRLKDEYGDDYKDSEEYLKIKVNNKAIADYEDVVAAIAVLDNGMVYLDRMNKETDSTIINYLSDLGDAENDYAVKYYKGRVEYIKHLIELEEFEETNKAALDTYAKKISAIKKQYKDKDGDYTDDVEYMKIQVEYKDILSKWDSLKSSAKTSKESCDKLKTEIEEKRTTTENNIAMKSDNDKVQAFLDAMKGKLTEVDTSGTTKTGVVCEIDGFYVVKISEDIVDDIDDSRYVKTTTSSSGNNYSSGSSSKCKWADGCSRTATHGNFCKTHWDYLYGAYKDFGGTKDNPYDY